MGSILRLAVCEDQPPAVYELLCGYRPHEVEFTSAGSGACQDFPLEVLLVELIASYSNVVLSPPLSVLVLGPLGRDSGIGQCVCL